MIQTEKKGKLFLILGILLMLQVIAAFCFCMKKTGFHYDEYYSYYSSNVTWGLVPTDREWKDGSEIKNEFAVLPQERFQYPTVIRMQTYDVHPPFYYILLHTVCSLTPGVFSKWAGLALNLLFFVGSWFLLAGLAWQLAGKAENGKPAFRWAAVFFTCLLYGFNPAVFSGIMLMRMYMLLGFLMLLLTWLHVRALEERRRGRKFWLPVIITIYLGFLTHYYFAVYLFFLAAAMECYLLFEKAEGRTWGQKWKDCILYGSAVVGAMLLAVVGYPACLGHIFRGYRGTEAMGAFFDLGNTLGRLRFFTGLLNEYAFGSTLPFLLLGILLLSLTALALQRTRKGVKAGQSFVERYRTILIPAVAAVGYFAVVTKTALLTAEEANRYQIPIYGLIWVLTVVLLALLVQKICALAAAGKSGKKIMKTGLIGLGAMLLLPAAGEIYGLAQNKVLFLYEEDADHIAFARQNHEVPVIYFYNGNLTWMIWDDSLELMQYDKIYFVNMADLSPLEDEEISAADRVFVYIARNESAQEALRAAEACMGDGAKAEYLRELLYCDLYEITK